jgi:type IV secretion system protein VirD4
MWASLPEVINHRFSAGDIFLGRPKLFIGGMLRPVGIRTERHMITIAGTGSGKSTAALIPNLCLHEGSALVIDPKGELAKVTAIRRGPGDGPGKGLGQGVHVVDPYSLTQFASSSYNPFHEMEHVSRDNPDAAVSYAGKIAEALVKPMSEKESYWDDAAKTFIRGLVLYVHAHEDQKRRNLLRLRELVMQGDVEGYDAAVKAGVEGIRKLTPFDVLMEKMKLARGGPHGDAIASAAGSIDMMGEGQRGSVITTAQEHTAFLDIPEIRKVSESCDFLLQDFKTDFKTVYLVLPINSLKGQEGRWLRMFVLLFIDMMMRVQQAPSPPVLLAIDEFPSLGRLEGIETVAPVMRSYGVRFWAVAQDISQLQAVYPDCWTGFIGGAEAVQFMGVNHPATAEFISERLGSWEVIREGRREARRLLDPEQVSRFLAKDHKNQIVWFGHKRPMKLKICPYFEYMPWWYYSRDGRFKERWRRSFWRALKGYGS